MWNPNITGAAAYVNYDRPIHILSGAAGCPENQDPWQPSGNPFSALRLNVYGYGRLQVRQHRGDASLPHELLCCAQAVAACSHRVNFGCND